MPTRIRGDVHLRLRGRTVILLGKVVDPDEALRRRSWHSGGAGEGELSARQDRAQDQIVARRCSVRDLDGAEERKIRDVDQGPR